MNQITRKTSKRLKDIAQIVDDTIKHETGERIGFTLIIYTPERASYISNVDRVDAIREMEFLLECWNKEIPDIKAHEVI